MSRILYVKAMVNEGRKKEINVEVLEDETMQKTFGAGNHGDNIPCGRGNGKAMYSVCFPGRI